jgi:hypothetical protein
MSDHEQFSRPGVGTQADTSTKVSLVRRLIVAPPHYRTASSSHDGFETRSRVHSAGGLHVERMLLC